MIGARVLVVDDHDVTWRVVGSYLALSGCVALEVGSGEEALEVLASKRIDIVLLDIQMPGKDGFETLVAMQERGLNEISVIFLSSFDRSNLKVKGLEMGAEDYVTKPCDNAELLARIKVVLRRSQRFARIQQQLGGSLEDMPLALLLQTLQISGKTATIHLTEPDSQVLLSAGRLVSASIAASGCQGEDALQKLLFAARGTFSIAFADPSTSPLTEAPRIEVVLMRLTPEIDEMVDLLRQGPGDSPQVRGEIALRPEDFSTLLAMAREDLAAAVNNQES